MKHIPKIVSITDLRQGAAEIIERISEDDAPIIIAQRSKAVAVLLGVRVYERMVYEREVLGILVKGETEIRDAKGVCIDDVLAETDRLLEFR